MLLYLHAAVLINFTYYAQYYAHVKDLCLGIQYFAIKLECFIRVYSLYKAKYYRIGGYREELIIA